MGLAKGAENRRNVSSFVDIRGGGVSLSLGEPDVRERRNSFAALDEVQDG
jgi:hypothetical protein